MPALYYPCCDVGDLTPIDPKRGVARGKCWLCGEPEFLIVEDLWDNKQHIRYYFFVKNTGLKVSPTDETPPWRI